MTGRARASLAVLVPLSLAMPAPAMGDGAALTVGTCLGRSISIPIDGPPRRPRDDRACHAALCPDRSAVRRAARPFNRGEHP